MKWHHIAWCGKVRPKEKGNNLHLAIAAHLTRYAFIVHKLHFYLLMLYSTSAEGL